MGWCVFASFVVWPVFFIIFMVWTSKNWKNKYFIYYVEFIDGGGISSYDGEADGEEKEIVPYSYNMFECIQVRILPLLSGFRNLWVFYVVWPRFSCRM